MHRKGPGADRREGGAAPSREDLRIRRAVLEATLEITGRRGYRAATVAAIVDRAGVDLTDFDSLFDDLSECFAAAYEMATAARVESVLDLAGASSDRESAASAAHTYLVLFATRRPETARAVLVEVYVAGGAALARHHEVLERLSRAVSDACRETDSSRHDPPPLAASFIVGGIEEAFRRRLSERREALLWEDLPELTAILLGARSD
jgi:AcrR family transcriptional regulator